MPERPDAVVVGAGLAGLRAAVRLHRLGFDVRVLEATDRVGGRVATDQQGGFTLDRGFQLYNPAYPAGRAVFDHEAFDLGQFDRGVEIITRGGQRARLELSLAGAPQAGIAALRGTAGSAPGLLALAKYAAACALRSPESLRQRPDEPITAALQAARVSPAVIQQLMTPFLSGVFADPNLATSRRYADLVLRSFVRGVPGVPARGMAQLPEQLAAGLPRGVVATSTPVDSVAPGAVRTAARTYQPQAVIVATEAPVARELLPGLLVPDMRALTTWYFAGPTELNRQRVLTVGTGLGGLANIAVMSAAAPSYAPTDRALLAATAVGHHPGSAAQGRAQQVTARVMGVDSQDLQPLASYPIKHALPTALSPFSLRQPVDLGQGMFVVGDHRDTPSIQGALVSGRRGADAAARYLTSSGSRSTAT